MRQIEIFRPGRHVATSGEAIAFSAADLRAAAAAYDPALHEAPLCAGHPVHDAPAYGWVKGLSFAQGALQADPHQIDPAFAELVKAGRFKKISAAFYGPASPSNPKPGAYYLRHVAFLGAQPPSVKGLKPVQFASSDGDALIFAESGALARLMRSLRAALGAQFGEAEADRALPPDALDALDADPADPACAGGAAGPADTDPDSEDGEDDAMTDAEKADFAERERKLKAGEAKLAAEEAKLAARAAEFAEGEARRRAGAAAAWLAGLEAEGRVLPAWRPGLLAVLERLEGAKPIAFGEGTERQELEAPEAFRQFLAALPVQVAFAEAARTPLGDGAARPGPAFEAPPGFALDPERVALRNRALLYAEEHKIDFVEAVKRLERAA